jgi:hypothetical protein
MEIPGNARLPYVIPAQAGIQSCVDAKRHLNIAL